MCPRKNGHKHRKSRLSRSANQVVNWRFFLLSSSILMLGTLLLYYIVLDRAYSCTNCATTPSHTVETIKGKPL